jgi:TorA maturation chaperone TorD
MKEQMLTVVRNRKRVYLFLAELFLTPIPTPGYEYAQRFCKAIDDFTDYSHGSNDEGLSFLKKFKDVTKFGVLENIQRMLAVDRTRLCRGMAKKSELIPPYEALYLMPEKEIDQILAIVQFYQRAGLKVGATLFERMDYIGVEFAFMGKLCEKELIALEADQEKIYEEVISLEKQFLNEHLLMWAIEYCDQMITQAQTDFFRGFGYLIRSFLLEEKEMFEQ